MAHQLTLAERERLCVLLAQGKGQAEIARCLARHRSTIGRELRRNHVGDTYSAVAAQQRSETRRRDRPLRAKMARPEINQDVRQGLAHYWSPDQIAGRLRLDFPDQPQRQVSHQTIYTWIDADQHRDHWQQFLRQGSHRRSGPEKRGKIVDPVAVADRPAAANRRSRYGDWEGDTVVSRRHHGGVLTLVERRSRYTLIEKVRDLQANTINAAMRAALGDLPKQLRRTMTLDNGKEFAGHQRLSKQLDLDIYFAEPYAAWQRGTVENTNGLLRQFFPKGTDFQTVRRPELQSTQDLLNNRPRKCLGYRTPAEVLGPRLGVAIEV
jgi:IS30 family transposase